MREASSLDAYKKKVCNHDELNMPNKDGQTEGQTDIHADGKLIALGTV